MFIPFFVLSLNAIPREGKTTRFPFSAPYLFIYRTPSLRSQHHDSMSVS